MMIPPLRIARVEHVSEPAWVDRIRHRNDPAAISISRDADRAGLLQADRWPAGDNDNSLSFPDASGREQRAHCGTSGGRSPNRSVFRLAWIITSARPS